MWSTSIPRSASNSSTSRYDSPKRRYQRTATTMTSGGKRKPAKADRGGGAGRGRRVLMQEVSLLEGDHGERNSARDPGSPASLPRAKGTFVEEGRHERSDAGRATVLEV